MQQNPALTLIERAIYDDIIRELHRIGIHCRVFSRIKEYDSLKEKIQRKNKDSSTPYYTETGRKMQDILGIRIVTYFYEDVQLLWDLFSKKYEVVDIEEAIINTNNFEALRKNMVCRMPPTQVIVFKEYINSLNEGSEYRLVDSTFEIQFRTTLSEGWHEVDHVLRYKCKDDWVGSEMESRMLNGIYATLETSDRALKALFDDLAYKHYKKSNWSAMVRSKFRLHFVKGDLSEEICKILDGNHLLAKRIFRTDRNQVIQAISESGILIPLSLDNLIQIVNYLYINDDTIGALVSPIIARDLNNRMSPFRSIDA